MQSTSPTLRDHYDIVIIGAGPSGLNALRSINRSGEKVSILLVDKSLPWERPIPCAEAVGRLGFHEAVEIKKSWIRFEVSNATFHSPDNTVIQYSDKKKGYVINRALMQQDLFNEGIEHGIDCRTNIAVTRVSVPENSRRTIHFSNGSQTSCSWIIDASGPNSRFGKGEKITWKNFDLEPAYFAVVKNVDIPTDTVHIQVGKALAPGGYAWVFPREEGIANIGVLVGKAYRSKINIRVLLDTYIQNYFPGGEIIQRFAGPIPCGYERSTLAVKGLIKTGDAANTINPVSRAGIVEAMISGKLAGEYALKMLGASTEKQITKLGKEYEKAWYEKRGKRHQKLAKVKNSLAKVPDTDYNSAARALSDIPQREMTMSKIFKTSLSRFPRLVWAMRHLM
ncbi:MAG: geranylgeranyl reductase family protein [Chitinivibrionales bacterium]|nr:geranylgeranyl reductase family protein [Chitinivibrionales bacterium]